jgi:polyphosphate kinase
MTPHKQKRYFNRDLSWLSFNYRVLQEAKDPRVPLYERIKFFAIYSSNLDEFYRIRVAAWKNLALLAKKTKKELAEEPAVVLKEIKKTVLKHHAELSDIFKKQILPGLQQNNVYLINEVELTKQQEDFCREYFLSKVIPIVKPVFINRKKSHEFVEDNAPYLAIRLCDLDKKSNKGDKPRTWEHAIVQIPTNHLPPYIELPGRGKKKYYIYVGDILKLYIKHFFEEYEIIETYAVKLSRDGELYLEDEFSGSLLKKIKRSLGNREHGAPTRLMYDRTMPKEFIKHLRHVFTLSTDDLIPAGRYHNYKDMFRFPVNENKALYDEPLPPLPHRELDSYTSYFDALKDRDYFVHYPYQSVNYLTNFINEAASDPAVKSIKITLYRVANNSKIISALIQAAQNKKQVTAFMELKARFDEENNLVYARELENAGVKVLYSFPLLKVHSKLLLVERKEGEKIRRYGYFSTGNFNEQTSKIYSDTGMFTANKLLTTELGYVFEFLADTRIMRDYKHLLVAPDHMRKDFYVFIDNEIKNALKGKKACITLKMNSIQDPEIIEKLYEAAEDGVEVRLIIRGICCLLPGVNGISENIKAISIVDRYLEHSRVFIFHNDGNPRIYLSSGDWMERNLSRRIEVAFPVYDEKLKTEIIDFVNLQWRDNVKARVINRLQNNTYRKSEAKVKIRSQVAFYEFLKSKHNPSLKSVKADVVALKKMGA